MKTSTMSMIENWRETEMYPLLLEGLNIAIQLGVANCCISRWIVQDEEVNEWQTVYKLG